MDDRLFKHLPPYQRYTSYAPSTTASFEELSSTTNTNNDATSTSMSSNLFSDTAPSRHNIIGTENTWIRRLTMNNQRLGANSSIPRMKSFWENEAEKERIEAEKCMQRHKLQRPYDFPKWRSGDAMSASLVASLHTPDMIPVDSHLPRYRIDKIHENENKAQEIKKLIQQTASTRPTRRTNFNNSMCLSLDDFNKEQWYSPDQIRSSIENDSIANIRETRDYFENASHANGFENQLVPRPFVADLAVLSPVPFNQALSVQCQPNFSPNSQFSSIPNPEYNQNIYSQPQQNGVNYHTSPTEPKVEPQLNGRPMTFLEKEILEVSRREAEFREQQKRLGHLTLEDTFELWRNGQEWNAIISRPQSSSGFHDDSGVENMTMSSTNN